MKFTKKLLCTLVAAVTCVMAFAPISINATNNDELNFNDYAIIDGGGSDNIKVIDGIIYIRKDNSSYVQSKVKYGQWSTNKVEKVTNNKGYYHGTTLKDVSYNKKTQYRYKIKTTVYTTAYKYEVTFTPTLMGRLRGLKAYTKTYYSNSWTTPSYYTYTSKKIAYQQGKVSYSWTQWLETVPSGTIVGVESRDMYQPVYTYYTWKQNYSWYNTGKKTEYKIKSDSVLHWSFYPSISDNQKLSGEALGKYGDNYIVKIDEYYISSKDFLEKLDKEIKKLAVDEGMINLVIVEIIAEQLDGLIINELTTALSKLSLDTVVTVTTEVSGVLRDIYDVITAENVAKQLVFTLLKKVPGMGLVLNALKLLEYGVTNKNVNQFRYYLNLAINSKGILGYTVITYESGVRSVRFAVIQNVKKVSFNAKYHKSWFTYESFTKKGNYYGNVDYLSESKYDYLFKLMKGECEVKVVS